mgnify:CR=1 FL=1
MIQKVKWNGEMVDGEVLFYEPLSQKWNEYRLEDGSLVKILLVVSKAMRVIGQRNEQGQPIYLLESTNIVTIIPSEQAMAGN